MVGDKKPAQGGQWGSLPAGVTLGGFMLCFWHNSDEVRFFT